MTLKGIGPPIIRFQNSALREARRIDELIAKIADAARVGETTAQRLVRSLGVERAEVLRNRLTEGMPFDDAIAGMGWPLESDFADGEPPPLDNPNPCHSCANYVGLRGPAGDTLHCGMHPYGAEQGASGEYLNCEDWESRPLEYLH